jgi:transcriptional regulator with PAS, ATPase and Fis domain
MGKRCSEVFRTDLCDRICPLRLSISSRRAVHGREVTIKDRSGRVVPIAVSTAPLLTPEGKLLGGVEVFRDLTQLAHLRRRLEGKYQLEDVIGKSQPMQRVLELLPLVAASDATVLVTGRSGTGKELISRTIHGIGPRRDGPFVAVSCAAIPAQLLESELFGYKRGAFTDARTDKPGRIAAADGGTLLLDEVGDLPASTQVKILRFLQDRTYEPLGSNQTVRADVRVIAATNRELSEMVRAGMFREDLFYRLNVVQIELPLLRERSEDIPLLLRHFLEVMQHTTGKPIEGFTDEALARLISYPFPGNVRELENLVERAFVLCSSGLVDSEHLPPAILASDSAPRPPARTTVAAAEQVAIEAALARCGGNRTRAAAELGIHRTTLLRKMSRLGLYSGRRFE